MLTGRRRGSRAIVFLLLGTTALLGPSACISTWRDLPAEPPSSATGAKYPGAFYYNVEVAPGMFGGGSALLETLRTHAPFATVEARSEAPGEGLFCHVDYQRQNPHLASGVAAYISYAFLFVIPFWSTEGYLFRYHLYVDGKEENVFEYEITRKSFFWLLVLPFSWVNFFTPSEAEAFSSTVHRFFRDAMPYFAEATAEVNTHLVGLCLDDRTGEVSQLPDHDEVAGTVERNRRPLLARPRERGESSGRGLIPFCRQWL